MDARGEAAALRWHGCLQQVAGAELSAGAIPEWTWRDFADLSPGDLYDFMALRQLVFVVEQECAYLDADGIDRDSRHLFTRDPSGFVTAYLRLVRPGVKYREPSIGRVITHPDARRAGLGRELMREGMRESERLYPGLGIRIAAQSRLETFYASLGFESIGEEYLEDGIRHIEMYRAANRPLEQD